MRSRRSVPTPVLLQPIPGSFLVSYHPHHAESDAISIQLDDPEHGRYLIAVTPGTAGHLSRLLATSVQSPRIQAEADQAKAAKRDR